MVTPANFEQWTVLVTPAQRLEIAAVMAAYFEHWLVVPMPAQCLETLAVLDDEIGLNESVSSGGSLTSFRHLSTLSGPGQ